MICEKAKYFYVIELNKGVWGNLWQRKDTIQILRNLSTQFLVIQ